MIREPEGRRLPRKERIRLVKLQAKLHYEHCTKCDKEKLKAKPEEKCGRCPVFKELRRIGGELAGKVVESKD